MCGEQGKGFIRPTDTSLIARESSPLMKCCTCRRRFRTQMTFLQKPVEIGESLNGHTRLSGVTQWANKDTSLFCVWVCVPMMCTAWGFFFLLFFVFFRCVHVRKCEFYMTNKLAKMRHLCLYDTLLAGHPLIACELTPAWFLHIV